MDKNDVKNWSKYYNDKMNKDKKDYDLEYNKSYNNHIISPKDNYILICGPSGVGKTNSIIQFIINSSYKKISPFVDIYYCSFSTVDEDLLKMLSKLLSNNLILIDNIKSLLELVDSFKDKEFNNKEKRLLILDDINNLSKKDFDIISKFSNSFRKYISHNIYVVQNPYSNNNLSTIRRNINYLFVFKYKQNNVIDRLIKEFNSFDNLSDEEYKKLYLKATKNIGNFLMIDLKQNNIRHNFLEILYEE
jgi:energy-coupling factor transporter ATP-binding protein EcfA2